MSNEGLWNGAVTVGIWQDERKVAIHNTAKKNGKTKIWKHYKNLVPSRPHINRKETTLPPLSG